MDSYKHRKLLTDQHSNLFLDAIASPSTYQSVSGSVSGSVSESVSESVIVSDFGDCIYRAYELLTFTITVELAELVKNIRKTFTDMNCFLSQKDD